MSWTDDKEAEHQRIRAESAEAEVERLREDVNSGTCPKHNDQCHQRAILVEAEVERLQRLEAIVLGPEGETGLQREVERLREENGMSDMQRLVSAEAENERLRAALKVIAEVGQYSCCSRMYPDRPDCSHNVARAVLGEEA